MIVQNIPIPHSLTLTAVPLTRDSFAPFGDVLTNPAPQSLPHSTAPSSIASGALPCGAISANQGTAIQYKQLGTLRNLYDQAPSRSHGMPRVTMFVCGARELSGKGRDEFEVKVLERHPFTTQTFVPLTKDGARTRYLVIVAPTLKPTKGDEGLPVPVEARDGKGGLPGSGLPDLSRSRAFIASGEQAVTYGAGTWHAPMVALGEQGTAVDFVVTQFANDTAVEDCQEVVLESLAPENSRITVKVPGQLKLAKL
ncbi:putative Ureidoglycolate hydrolase [Seiridium unicorne]|uniref:Ureidoglycolate hydrolase n=1 Tax=Seiridium unicorne TaxID=138068 RepID=A0ABR2UER1_9PEZI